MHQPSRSASTTGAPRAVEVVLPAAVEPAGLRIRAVPTPTPGPGQAVLRMEATGISFAEQQMRLGTYYDQPPFPFVPGYDVVGVVTAVGDGVDAELGDRRVAAVVKVGGWASHVVVDAADLVPVPEGLDPAAVETVLVNGVTAWQMLHRGARVPAGSTVVVLSANGGVGSTLVQLAREAGIRVIATSSVAHHERIRALGAAAVVDREDPRMYDRIRELVPDGVDAVFDAVGGPDLARSFALLGKGGSLISYGWAATKASTSAVDILAHFGRLRGWNLLPNGRSASFYDFWAGKARHTADFRARLRADLTQVLRLLADGRLTAQVAATFPLSQVSTAMELAESHTVVGKVVLVADSA